MKIKHPYVIYHGANALACCRDPDHIAFKPFTPVERVLVRDSRTGQRSVKEYAFLPGHIFVPLCTHVEFYQQLNSQYMMQQQFTPQLDAPQLVSKADLARWQRALNEEFDSPRSAKVLSPLVEGQQVLINCPELFPPGITAVVAKGGTRRMARLLIGSKFVKIPRALLNVVV